MNKTMKVMQYLTLTIYLFGGIALLFCGCSKESPKASTTVSNKKTANQATDDSANNNSCAHPHCFDAKYIGADVSWDENNRVYICPEKTYTKNSCLQIINISKSIYTIDDAQWDGNDLLITIHNFHMSKPVYQTIRYWDNHYYSWEH